MSAKGNRPLRETERRLARWMLENGIPEANDFLPQIYLAEVTPWRCQCGCATIKFEIEGCPPAPPGVHVLGDFTFDIGNGISGIFIYESKGILSGPEVFRLSSNIPDVLPPPESLRPVKR